MSIAHLKELARALLTLSEKPYAYTPEAAALRKKIEKTDFFCIIFQKIFKILDFS